MWTTQKHVPRWDLSAGLAGAQLGVKTPLSIHEGASRHILRSVCNNLPRCDKTTAYLLVSATIHRRVARQTILVGKLALIQENHAHSHAQALLQHLDVPPSQWCKTQTTLPAIPCERCSECFFNSSVAICRLQS